MNLNRYRVELALTFVGLLGLQPTLLRAQDAGIEPGVEDAEDENVEETEPPETEEEPSHETASQPTGEAEFEDDLESETPRESVPASELEFEGDSEFDDEVDAEPAVETQSEPVDGEEETDVQTVAQETSLLDILQERVQLHGFVSQGFLISTDNNFLGQSSRGSFEFFEAALNATGQITPELRAGIQVFARDVGDLGNFRPILDWGFLDYRWREWLGFRGGRFKLPFGLYNEYADIDAGRLWVLQPQALYPIQSRNFLLAVNGFGLYGRAAIGPVGSLQYDAYVGTGFLEATDSITSTDVKVLTGARLMWSPPVTGLRVGGSFLYTDVGLVATLDPAVVEGLDMAGALPEDFDGTVDADLERVRLWVVSLEFARGDWLLSAEYSRWRYNITASIPAIIPGGQSNINNERFYLGLSYRITDWLQLGGYFAARFQDANDRNGDDSPRFDEPHEARQLDAALTFRFDVNDHWLWKLEGHYFDGTAGLDDDDNPNPSSRWGLFLVKTTVVL